MKRTLKLLLLCCLFIAALAGCKDFSQVKEAAHMTICIRGKFIKLDAGGFGVEGNAIPFNELSVTAKQKKVRYRLRNDSAHTSEAENRLKNHNGKINGIFSIEKVGTSEDWSTIISIVSLS